jgi:pimeloyl-ACP methyl ester carboxylesterase
MQNPVCYIHGLFGSNLDFIDFLDDLSVAINLEDFDCDNLDFDSMTSLIIKHLLNIHNRPWNLVGYSMGGRIALFMKFKFPNAIHQVVVIGSALSYPIHTILDRIRFQLRWELLLASKPLNEFYSIWYSQALFSDFNFQAHLDKKLKIQKSFHQKCLNRLSILNQPPLETLLLDDRHLLKFLYGEFDGAYKNHYKNIQKMGYQVLEVPKASHVAFLDNPHFVKQHIRQFLLCN